MASSTGRIVDLIQYTQSAAPTAGRFNADEECAICLTPLSEEGPYNALGNDRFQAEFDGTFLACSAGHPFHSHCILRGIMSQRSSRGLEDRCPQCRRRLFIDIEYVKNRQERYQARVEWASEEDRPDHMLVLNEVMQVRVLLDKAVYERGLEAWVQVEVVGDSGEPDEYTRAMERAEELDQEIERQETSL
ncbi:ring finger protein 32 [Diplodia corticola]|uniref:Ring finger protein 32 n=1 Tax=Diplodia corticola TaxID=236234 RepID=A0A1J9RKG1_9PEZI|nr:ring finger protein 32 [Diplodia corticola]OJD29007.1 ring finger protein 32 [Diplodia corticola]